MKGIKVYYIEQYWLIQPVERGGDFFTQLQLYDSFRQKCSILDTSAAQGLKIQEWNKSFDFLKSVPSRTPQKRRFLGACSASRALTSLYHGREKYSASPPKSIKL
jgi:hypothetical protein